MRAASSFRLLRFYSISAALLIVVMWLGHYHPRTVLFTDFLNDWTAAHLVRDDALHFLFDKTAYNLYMRQLHANVFGGYNWSYPPHLLPLLTPFAFVSYELGLAVWSALGLVSIWGVLRLVRPALPARWRWLILLSPACLVNLLAGQTGFFCAALLLGGLYLLPKHPARAGILFGILTIKPHLGLLLALALLVRREWCAIGWAIFTSSVMIGASLLLWGVEPWIGWFTETRIMQVALLENFQGLYTYLMPGLLPALRMLGMPLAWAWGLQAMLSLALTFLVLRLIAQEGFSARGILALALGTVLITPYAFNYDMVMLSVALGVYAATLPRLKPIFCAIWIIPILVTLLNRFYLPLCPVLLLLGITQLLYKQPDRKSVASA